MMILFLGTQLDTYFNMNNFICSECGTKYSSPETTPPPGIKWSDGHVCTPKPVKDETNPDRMVRRPVT